MRASHARRTPEQKAAIAAKASAKLKGLKRSPEQCERNSQAQKGKSLSDAHKQAVSEGLKTAYAEGRKTVVPEFTRKGMPNSSHTRDLLSAALKGRVVWNAGISTGPRSSEITARIVASRKSNGVRVVLPPVTAGTRAKLSLALTKAWSEGRRVLSPLSGYGKGSYYNTPFQGSKWLRSRSEVQRAKELDAEEVVWFYELSRFSVQLNGRCKSYLPDFWVFPDSTREQVRNVENLSQFLLKHNPRIEDVKGWWSPQAFNFEKIAAFREQYPHLNFEITIRSGK